MLDCDANYTFFGGDLNTDISRNTPHTHSLAEYINENDLTFCTELEHVDVPYTYMCKDENVTYTSQIDHFIVNSNLCDKIDNCFIIDEFYSDHAAPKISITISVPHTNVNKENPYTDNNKVSWSKANDIDITKYKYSVEEQLKMIDCNCDLFRCKDVTCVQLVDMLQNVYENVLANCIDSADECISKVNIGKNKEQQIPGWNDYVVV